MRYGHDQLGDQFSTDSTDGGSGGGDESDSGGFRESASERQLERDLIETIDPQGPDYSRQRLEAHMKPVYNPGENGSQWDKLLNAIAGEFEDWVDSRNNVMEAGFVDTAQGPPLEKIGEIVQTPRRSGESVEHYRARLKVAFHRHIASGTVGDVKKTSALMLDTDASNLTVIEDFDAEPARFQLNVPSYVLDEAGVSVSEYRDLIDDVKAAGVRVLATEVGSFTYRSEQDYQNGINEQSKGYNGLDANGDPRDIGGGYSGLI